MQQTPTHHSNYGDGRGGSGQNRGRLFIIWHGTGKYPTVTAEQELEFLQRPGIRVSYHYYLTKRGEIHQLVPTDFRAWHAGSSTWAEDGEAWSDLNDWSIGVAFESCNGSSEVYPPAQFQAGLELARHLMSLHPSITAARNLTHKEVSDPPGRKVDPVNFPIHAFRRQITPVQRQVPLYSESNQFLGTVTLVEERKAYLSNELRKRL
jgi:N-acetylmuramoyl-L-alanine amidase